MSALDRSGLRRGESIGRYVVLDQLGAGGMGVVVAAYDPELDRRVAVKLLRGKGGSNDPRTARLQREAKSLARLVHPNVVSVFDVGKFEGSVFVTMEYVEGETLAERMAAWRRDEAPGLEVVATYVEAGRGLAAAHEVGIVHRDFKPANVMVASDGRVVVLDFGLAHEVDSTATGSDGRERVWSSDPRLTRTGTMLGTPAYMSPEQVSHDAVGPASDQFSFCVSLFEALYGHRPFSGDSVAELVENVTAGSVVAPRSRDDVPSRIHDALMRGLSRDPWARFESMDALLACIAPPRAHPRRWRVAVVAALVGVGVAAWAFADAPLDPCEGVSEAIDDVWHGGVAEQLERRFAEVEGSFGQDVATRIVPQLDNYARQWAQGRREACVATRVEQSANEAVLFSRTLCYDRALAALDGWLAAGSDANGPFIGEAPGAVGRLPDLAECESEAVDLRRAAAVADPQARATMMALEARLERAEHLADRADYDRAHPLVEGALDQAVRARMPLLEARAWGQLSRLLTSMGRPASEVLEAARTAVLRAEVAGDDRILIDTLVNEAFLSGIHFDDLRGARRALERLEAVVQRDGGRPSARLEKLRIEGKLHLRLGEVAEGIEALEQAVEVSDGYAKRSAERFVGVLVALTSGYVRAGRVAEAEDAALRALSVGTDELGQDHPTNGLTQFTLGRVEAASGDFESGLAAYRRAQSIFEARFPPSHPNHAAVRNEIGRMLRSLDRHDEALVEFRAALERTNRVFGPERVEAAVFHGNAGLVLQDLERFDEAVEHFGDALRISSNALGAGSIQVFYDAVNLGGCLVEAGRLDEAERVLREADLGRVTHHGSEDVYRAEIFGALGVIELLRGEVAAADELLTQAVDRLAPDVEAWVRGQTLVALAKVRWEQGRHDDARSLARDGIRVWAEGANAEATGVGEARAWLSNHEG